MEAKERHKIAMLEYWGNPENDFVNRHQMAHILDISKPTFYKHFTPDELLEIEQEAMELRKKQSIRQRSILYKSLYQSGVEGNVQAIKEFLDRIEGKVADKVQSEMKLEITLIDKYGK